MCIVRVCVCVCVNPFMAPLTQMKRHTYNNPKDTFICKICFWSLYSVFCVSSSSIEFVKHYRTRVSWSPQSWGVRLPRRSRRFTPPPTHTPCWEGDRGGVGGVRERREHTHTHTDIWHPSPASSRAASPSTPRRWDPAGSLDAGAWIMNFTQFTGDTVSSLTGVLINRHTVITNSWSSVDVFICRSAFTCISSDGSRHRGTRGTQSISLSIIIIINIFDWQAKHGKEEGFSSFNLL